MTDWPQGLTSNAGCHHLMLFGFAVASTPDARRQWGILPIIVKKTAWQSGQIVPRIAPLGQNQIGGCPLRICRVQPVAQGAIGGMPSGACNALAVRASVS